jgi:hypothetical protein
MNNRLIKSNDAGGGGCTNTVDLYNPFPDGGGVALYRLNGDATDESGNYDATTVTDITWGGAGEFGTSAAFNGSSSYLEILNPNYDVRGNFSLSLWFKLNNLSTNQTLFSKILDTSEKPLTIRVITDGRLLVEQEGNNSNYNKYSIFGVSAGNWYHLVWVADALYNGELFINGESFLTTNPGVVNINNGVPSLIGIMGAPGSVYDGSDPFNGSIDQVRIFNRALRPYEVEALYTEEYCTPTIVPSEHFNTVTYSGNGSTQSITGVGFAPDLVWIKTRNEDISHIITDSARGIRKTLFSDRTDAELEFSSNGLISFDSDGFTVSDLSGNQYGVNGIGKNHVAWNFKAGGAAVLDQQGDIDSYVSANTEAGFSIVSYTGNGQDIQTVGHGLGNTPSIVITKNRNKSDSLDGNWAVAYMPDLTAGYLNTTNGFDSNRFDVLFGSGINDNIFTVSVGGPIGYGHTNGNGDPMIAYCFAEVEGFSSIGSYVGNGSASGPIINCGFEPAFVMIKGANVSPTNWNIHDNKRDTDSFNDKFLFANLSNQEIDDAAGRVIFLSNGFQIGTSDFSRNESGYTYIYMAFAADPTTVEPTLEDSFNTVTYDGNGTSKSIDTVGFQPDLVWIKSRTDTFYHILQDSVRGAGKTLFSNDTNAETGNANDLISSFDNNGFTVNRNYNGATNNGSTNENNFPYVAWAWKGAELPAINSNGSIPSVVSANPAAGFSIVSYTGTGNTVSFGHGLEKEPDCVIIKNRDRVVDWTVYFKVLGSSLKLRLSQTSAAAATGNYANTNPTNDVFTVSANDESGFLNENYIAYCFAEVAGFSKFGSHTTAAKITTGFEPAWVMIKYTGTTSDWWVMDLARWDGTSYGSNGGKLIKPYLDANTSDAEGIVGNGAIEVMSDGFYPTNFYNAGGAIHMAFANQF